MANAAFNENPRELLQNEFSRRIGKNPRYSLRAFSRALGLSHTVVSLVMSGKRPLSKRAAFQVASQLGLSPEESFQLFSHREKSEPFLAEPSVMDLDRFSFISDWHHFAILSLLDLPNARPDVAWIARRLNIPTVSARSALERMLRLGLIEKKTNGRWRQTRIAFRLDPRQSTAATRRFQHQLLEKAIHSLENEPLEKRDHSSTTFAMDPAMIPYAKAKIQRFRRQLSTELEGLGTPKVVYNLTVQLVGCSTEDGA